MVTAWSGVRKPAVTEEESLKQVSVRFCMIAMLWNAVDNYHCCANPESCLKRPQPRLPDVNTRRLHIVTLLPGVLDLAT